MVQACRARGKGKKEERGCVMKQNKTQNTLKNFIVIVDVIFALVLLRSSWFSCVVLLVLNCLCTTLLLSCC